LLTRFAAPQPKAALADLANALAVAYLFEARVLTNVVTPPYTAKWLSNGTKANGKATSQSTASILLVLLGYLMARCSK